ncbi:MAG: ATP-binding protein [Nitrospira sp.]
MKLFENEKPFDLLRWFAFLSFICIALISSVSAFFLSQFLTNTILQLDAVEVRDFVQSHTREGDVTLFFEEADSGIAEDYFEEQFMHIVSMPEVVRANVYDKQGNVLWSDDERMIGHNFMPNLDLITALTGTLASTSGTSGKPTKGEHVFDKEVPFFVEVYVPIRNNDGRIVGVVEIYKEPLALFNTLQRGKALIWASAALGGVFLYIFLFWIVRRADETIHSQHEELLESQTSALVGEMTEAIAHGIRNPLASIRSSAEVALEQASVLYQDSGRLGPDRSIKEAVLEEDEDDPSSLFATTAGDIITEADRLSGWIRELLTYARISRGEFTTIQINNMIRSVLDSSGARMENLGIKVILDLEESALEIKGDELSLHQMFVSLTSNSVEAMPDGGKITMRTRFDTINRWVKLEIIDTGKGIPKDKLKDVFTPFFTTKSKGIGVGLSLAKRIIARHHGTIRLESREGVGTTLSLQIPISE